MCSYILSNARGDTCWNKGETTTIRLSLCCPLVFVKKKTIFNSCYAGQGFHSFYFVFFYVLFFFLNKFKFVPDWVGARPRVGFYLVWDAFDL